MNAPVESVPVIQADRDAAAVALGYRDWEDATDYRLTGDQDRLRDEVVQAFARYRTNQVAELVDTLALIAAMLKEHEGEPSNAGEAQNVAESALVSHKGEQP